ncbi:MAG TPA: VWA domain-containing protein [Candidatus Limnocylindrales bacterium]|nr:VWA domain-containing protein [Candidatus Limnocylindrales bacterium]
MKPKSWAHICLLGLLIALLGIPPEAIVARAQEQGPVKPPQTQPPAQPTPPSGQPQQQAAQQQEPQSQISVQSNLVNIDAVVTDQDGNILTGLKRENFRVLDEGQPQQISNFAPTDAPITVVILMEFSNKSYGFWQGAFGYKAKMWAYDFLNHLGPKDWVAFKIFDLKTRLIDDFTQNKNQVAQDIASLYFPDFSESNLFDALLETLDQLRDVHGRKAILLLATGFDTFSKHNLDQTYKVLKETDTTVFCVGMGEEIDLYHNSPVSYAQAKNQLNQFAMMTGGYAWFPRFQGEANDIFNSVAAFLRAQYTIAFSPSTPQDGRYHKLKIEVVDPQGNPLMVANKKGKEHKVTVFARQGYTALSAPPAGN